MILVIPYHCGITAIKSSFTAAGALLWEPWCSQRYWICLALDGAAGTFRLNLFSAWRRYWICIVLDSTAASCWLNLFIDWRHYLNFYNTAWNCGIPLTLSSLIAVSVTLVNVIVFVSLISIFHFCLFATHSVCVFMSPSYMVFIYKYIMCIIMPSSLMLLCAANTLVSLLSSLEPVAFPR